MDLNGMIEQSVRNAIVLHQTYNNSHTSANLEYIQKLAEHIKELKRNNLNLKMNYNELFFDFTNYRAINGDNEQIEPNYTHDAIDIYDETIELD
jgi:hypothetical protein